MHPRSFAFTFVLCLLLPAACGRGLPVSGVPDADAAPPDTSAPAPDVSENSSAPADPPPPEGRLRFPRTESQLTADYKVDIQGSGSGPVGAIQFADNVGTVVLDGKTLSGFITERQPWPAFNLMLFQTLVIDSDRLYLFWFYCTGEALTWVYYNGTRVELSNGQASGTCGAEVLSAPMAFPVTLGPLDMPRPAPFGGYAVTGSDEIRVSPGEVGYGIFAERPWDIHVFEDADCSKECGSPGWYELHSVLQDRSDPGRLGVVIIYLREEGAVQAFYGIQLPSLDRIPGAVFTGASWSRP